MDPIFSFLILCYRCKRGFIPGLEWLFSNLINFDFQVNVSLAGFNHFSLNLEYFVVKYLKV